jgi:MOSC domain-containing protein YiiM
LTEEDIVSDTRPTATDETAAGAGSVRAIWLKRFHGGPMDPVESATLVAGRGIENDANFGSKREVTLIDAGRWHEAQRRLGTDVDPAARRANLLLSGVNLMETRGKVLRVGNTRLRVLGETRPCQLMDEACQGLKVELQRDWGGGAHAEVLEGGEIRPGDAAGWE